MNPQAEFRIIIWFPSSSHDNPYKSDSRLLSHVSLSSFFSRNLQRYLERFVKFVNHVLYPVEDTLQASSSRKNTLSDAGYQHIQKSIALAYVLPYWKSWRDDYDRYTYSTNTVLYKSTLTLSSFHYSASWRCGAMCVVNCLKLHEAIEQLLLELKPCIQLLRQLQPRNKSKFNVPR